MKFYGDLDVGENFVRNVVINDDGAFQSTPKIGRLTFNGKRLYICVDIVSGKPVWIPLTNEISIKTIKFESAATTWTLTHNLNTSMPIIQVYDETNNQIIPDSIQITSANEAVVRFTKAALGFAVIATGTEEGLSKPNVIYTQPITTPTQSVTLNHNLGYFPTVTAYDVNGVMVLPKTVIQQSLFSTDITFEASFAGTVRLS